MIVDVLQKNLATNKNGAIPNTNRPSRTKTIDAPSDATDKASRCDAVEGGRVSSKSVFVILKPWQRHE